jgi:hypothetical protein
MHFSSSKFITWNTNFTKYHLFSFCSGEDINTNVLTLRQNVALPTDLKAIRISLGSLHPETKKKMTRGYVSIYSSLPGEQEFLYILNWRKKRGFLYKNYDDMKSKNIESFFVVPFKMHKSECKYFMCLYICNSAVRIDQSAEPPLL